MDLRTQITTIEDWWKNGEISMNPPFAPTQAALLSLIDGYWMDKFRDGDSDPVGRKSFLNILRNPTEVAQKMIDFDTKDIRVIAEEGQSYWASWLYQIRLKAWMKEKGIAKFLNQIIFTLPKYGHVVTKRFGTNVGVVNLSQFMANPFADGLTAGPTLECHYMTETQLKGMKDWNTDAVLDIEPDEEGDRWTIYEFCDPSYEGDNYWVVYLGAKKEEDTILFSGRKKNAYREHKWENVPGRAMGRGIPERLFQKQIFRNDTWNMFKRGLLWGSKHMFQTRDETIQRNLLTGAKNGDVIRSLSEIIPIQLEQRNLSAYNFADRRIDAETAKDTFSYSTLSGERTPAGTPLGSAILSNQQAATFYDLKREDLGIFIRDLIVEDITPEFEKENDKEHTINLIGDEEFDKFKRVVVNGRVNQKMIQSLMRNGSFPSQQERDLVRSIEETSLKPIVRIPKGYYKDIKHKVDVVLTNEQLDTGAKLSTLQTILSILGSNPAIIQNPQTRKILAQMVNTLGMSPVDFDLTEDMETTQEVIGRGAMEAQKTRGGSIARPQPVMGELTMQRAM